MTAPVWTATTQHITAHPGVALSGFSRGGVTGALVGVVTSDSAVTTSFPFGDQLPTGITLSASNNGDGSYSIVAVGTVPGGTANSSTVVTIAATNATSSAYSDGTMFSVAALVPPVFNSASLGDAHEGVEFYQTLTGWLLTSQNRPADWSVSAGALPAGLEIIDNWQDSSHSILSGTPTEAGTFSFTLTATTSDGSVSKAFTLVVTPPHVGPKSIAPSTFTASQLADGSITVRVDVEGSWDTTFPANDAFTTEVSIDGGVSYQDSLTGDISTGLDGTISVPRIPSVRLRARLYEPTAVPTTSYAVPEGGSGDYIEIDTSAPAATAPCSLDVKRTLYSTPTLTATVTVLPPQNDFQVQASVIELHVKVGTAAPQVAWTVPTTPGTYTHQVTGLGMDQDSTIRFGLFTSHPQLASGALRGRLSGILSLSDLELAPGNTATRDIVSGQFVVTAHLVSGRSGENEAVFTHAHLHADDGMDTQWFPDTAPQPIGNGDLTFTGTPDHAFQPGAEVNWSIMLTDDDGNLVKSFTTDPGSYTVPYATAEEINNAVLAPGVASMVQAPFSRFRFEVRFIAPVPAAAERQWHAQFRIGGGAWQELAAGFSDISANGFNVTTPALHGEQEQDYRFIGTHATDGSEAPVLVYISAV